MFCFFKQKTAYEMRISDWSSDVCSSDLAACPGHGACGGQFTANTMACVGEAIGLSLPNSNMMPAPYEGHADISRAAGRPVMELIARNIRPRAICTRDAFENAARIVAATGGSTNGGLHLTAMAPEAVLAFNILHCGEIFNKTPITQD